MRATFARQIVLILEFHSSAAGGCPTTCCSFRERRGGVLLEAQERPETFYMATNLPKTIPDLLAWAETHDAL